MNWEDYVVEGTNVLKNKHGVETQKEISELEIKYVLPKIWYVHDFGFEGNFDSKHLCDLHYFLFSDLYDFAGKYREVVMFGEYSGFLEPELIPLELENVMKKYKDYDFHGSKFEIAMFLAEFYYELIMIHPFREGNGRTIRAFIRQFIKYKFPEYTIDLQKVDKKKLLQGIVEKKSYPTYLALEFFNALAPREEKIKTY